MRRGRTTSPAWRYGLLGGLGLSAATVVKIVLAVPRILAGAKSWRPALLLPALTFGMGFVCGVLAWSLRGLGLRLGAAGDGLIGVLVMNVFFMMCMLVFDPSMLSRFRKDAGPMLGMATVLGAFAGVLFGRDFRRESMDDPPAPGPGPPRDEGSA